MGVTQICYETTGALIESGLEIIPGSQSAGTSFSFAVPYGVSDPDVKIHAYAVDAQGNTDGRYAPQSGNTGTISFDSTRMGSDGDYEFYTIGVDLAGNRETAPEDGGNVLADQTISFTAGTVWTIINTDTTIVTGDTSLDNRNIRVNGATITISGSHTFHNIELLNGAMLTHEETTADMIYQFNITVWSMTIDDNNSRIDVTGRGYIGGRGDNEYGRTQGNVYGSSNGTGGSHGGLGGVYSSGVAGPVYGSLTDPVELGSGGGAWEYTDGGDGGGLITLNAINLIVDGDLEANGGESAGSAAGDGSGGTINITARTLSGAGSITANGGGQNTGTGGGGGRIAVRYLDMATMDINKITTLGDDGEHGNGGANGTVYLKQNEETNGAIVITGRGPDTPWTHLTIPEGYGFDTITLSNQARVLADDPIVISGTLLVTGNSVLSHSTGNEAGLVIDAATIQVDQGSAIDMTGRGYRGGTDYNERGHTLGDIEGASYGAGGSYGGQGAGYINADSYIVYGDPKQPDELGSGGGAWEYTDGGNGGGRICLIVDTVIVNGAIRANGGESAGSAAGDGSGGAILIHTSQLTGLGVIEANGGGNGNGVAGGGGRVAIYCDYVNPEDNLADLYNITALAGHGQYDDRQASAGTVYIEYNNQDNSGVLYIDDKVVDGDGNPNGTASQSTPLLHIGFGTAGVLIDQDLDGAIDTLTTDGLVRMLPNGLIGLRINPDTNQDQSFVILGNTDSTITVETPNENGILFVDVADQEDTYAGTFTYDNLAFRRGGNLVPGDLLTVTGTMTINEYGLLTHFNTTTTLIFRLDLLVNNLVIEETGRIDTTGRGYIGGRGYNEFGRTLGNEYGSSNAAGGSHGGLGGVYGSGVPGSVYGSLTDPIDLGSGGGAYEWLCGGNGGGRIFITATNMTVNGAIRSNGGESGGSAAGDGSGGTVNIVTETLEGYGTIEANGGGNNSGVGGGGGKIAIDCTGSFTLDEANIQAAGGQGYYGTHGQDGSIYME